MQHGATAVDLVESLDSCTLCGACEPACPESIDLVGMVTALRGELALQKGATGPFNGVSPAPTGETSPPTMLIADQALATNPELLQAIVQQFGGDLAIHISIDSGADISSALTKGLPIPAERLEYFLAPLKTTLRVIVADGRLFYALKNWLHGVTVASLGEALSALPQVREKLSDSDLYIVEPVAFHRDHDRLIHHYDELRRTSGCSMNLDLQRMAIPTTANSGHSRRVGVDGQLRWILQGRNPQRIVVEDFADLEVFRSATSVPVVHLGALL